MFYFMCISSKCMSKNQHNVLSKALIAQAFCFFFIYFPHVATCRMSKFVIKTSKNEFWVLLLCMISYLRNDSVVAVKSGESGRTEK